MSFAYKLALLTHALNQPNIAPEKVADIRLRMQKIVEAHEEQNKQLSQLTEYVLALGSCVSCGCNTTTTLCVRWWCFTTRKHEKDDVLLCDNCKKLLSDPLFKGRYLYRENLPLSLISIDNGAKMEGDTWADVINKLKNSFAKIKEV